MYTQHEQHIVGHARASTADKRSRVMQSTRLLNANTTAKGPGIISNNPLFIILPIKKQWRLAGYQDRDNRKATCIKWCRPAPMCASAYHAHLYQRIHSRAGTACSGCTHEHTINPLSHQARIIAKAFFFDTRPNFFSTARAVMPDDSQES